MKRSNKEVSDGEKIEKRDGKKHRMHCHEKVEQGRTKDEKIEK